MKKLLCISVFASFFFLFCNNSVDSLGDENLSISTKESAVILTNNTDEVIHYILIEYETSTVVDLDPNVEWPAIEGNSEVSIPYSEIMGYQDSSDEAFIMWGIENRSSGNSLKFKL